MEMNATHGSIVLVEAINESAHAVIPELDDATVQTRQDPWPLAVEAQPFHSITLRLELRQHFLQFFSPNPHTEMRTRKIEIRIQSKKSKP